MTKYERKLWGKGLERIAGVDEAGRGPLAGPVVAAAVIFPKNTLIPGINDSKKLSARKRDLLFLQIFNHAKSIGVGVVHSAEIDEINILQATYQAMRKALNRLSNVPQHVLVDGRDLPEHNIPQTAVIKGDSKSHSIAAASIVAKVVRDRLMIKYDCLFPDYGFSQHKGYGTRGHIEAIRNFGLCPIHRRSFHIKGFR